MYSDQQLPQKLALKIMKEKVCTIQLILCLFGNARV